jgi:hypothetical protein
MHHSDTSADAEDFFHIAADHQNGNSALCQSAHEFLDLSLRTHIDAACRLVKDQDLGIQ